MQGQQQYIMEPTHAVPGKIPGTGAAPLWSKDTLAQEAKIPDTGDALKDAEANQHNQVKFRVRRNGPIRLWDNADKLLPDARGHIWQPQKQTCI